ncbi:MAG: hypothetical protein ACO1O6_13410 [Bacteroidota bacterium]
MSWTDDEIDALFKEIPTQHKPSPFQDSFFDEIEPLLPQKRSRNGLFWVLGSALIALLTTFIYSDFTPADGKAKISRQFTSRSAAREQATVSSAHAEQKPELKSLGAKAPFANQSYEPAEQQGETNAAHKASGLQTASFRAAQQPALRGSDTKTGDFIINDDRAVSVQSQRNPAELPNETLLAAVDHNPAIFRNESEGVDEHVSEVQQAVEFISPSITSELSLLGLQAFHTDTEKEIQALYLPMLHRKHFITLEAGAGFTENFIKMDNASQKPMPTASLGLSYQYRTKGLFYSAGFNWMNFSPNSLTLNRQSKVYDFNVTSYSQNIAYKWITLVEMPLTIGKRFRNHSFSAGIAPSLVLGSMVDIIQTENGLITNDYRMYGNMTGLKQFSASVHVAYDLHIARNLDFGVKVSNMLVNPLDETRFIGNLNKNPFQAQITLKKHFRIK